MTGMPSPNGINIPAWTAIMRKFRGEPDATEQFADGLASEMNQLVTHDNLAAQLGAVELQLVRWIIGISALNVGVITSLNKFT